MIEYPTKLLTLVLCGCVYTAK